MAETMTYDPGTDSVTTENNLTEDEQNSLEVGQELVDQQEQLLAGKYKTAQELEKAYAELESKLGQQSTETEPDVEETVESEPEDTEVSFGEELITQASTEYWENDGQLSKDTIEQFSSLSSQELVQAYMDYTKANPTNQASQQAAVDLTDREVNTIKNSVGGEEEYNQMTEWASTNLDPDIINAFDSLLDSGNSGAIQLAVNGLMAQYENATGYEGRMLSGKPPQSSGDTFRSQAELVSAMGDPRYDNDPAYRQDIIEKLDRSDLSF